MATKKPATRLALKIRALKFIDAFYIPLSVVAKAYQRVA